MPRRVVSTFSLLILFCVTAWAGPSSGTSTARPDPLLTQSLPTDQTAQREIQQIKSSPLYRDDQVSSANWLSRATSGFWEWLQKLFKRNEKSADNLPAPPSILGPIVVYGMWVILGGLVLFFVYLAVRHVKWKVNLKRRSKALLEEDEPERTLDEWLERADALEAEGKYREAVRCLYLACLLRFDEARVARFDRGQTNWEHLERIQASQALPTGLNFQPATLAFDHIWYGMRTQGSPDVERFRVWYREIDRAFLDKAA